MSRAETFLKLALGEGGIGMLESMCSKLGYDDSDRELAAEVILVSWIDAVKDDEDTDLETLDTIKSYWQIPTCDNPFGIQKI